MIRLAILNFAGLCCMIWASSLGYVQFAYAADTTPISLTIVALFIFGLGVTAYRAYSPSHEGNELLRDIANWCAGLGMFGTVIGLIMMTISLRGTDISNANQLAKAINLAFDGYGVALVTTAVGFVFGLWTEINFRCIKIMAG